MRKHGKVLVLGLVVAALFLLGAATVSAAGPETGIQPYEIKLVVDEQGGWSIPSLGGVDLGLDSSAIESVATTLGLQMQLPRVDPSLVKMAMDNNVQTIALVKEGEINTILVNNQPVTGITLSDAALDVVAGFLPELKTLLAGFNRTYVAIGVQLPAAAGKGIEVEFGARLTAVQAAEAPSTAVDLGVTVSPDGQVLSMGGMDPAQLGLALPAFDVSILKTLGLDQVDAQVTTTGLTLIANDAELATINWNPIQWEAVPDVVTQLSGAQLAPGIESVLSVASGWLEDSQINLTAYVAEEPKDETPRLALGRPLEVRLLEDGNLSVEGLAVRTGFEATLAQVQQVVGPVAIAWNGEENKLIPVIGDQAMPVLTMDEGFLSTVGGMFVPNVDWAMLTNTLSGVQVAASLATETGAAADTALLAYVPEPERATYIATSNIQVSRTTGDVAVLGTTLPLTFVERLTGLEITDVISQYVSPFADVNMLDVRVGPSGVVLGVNGKTVTIAWDEQTRGNLIDVLMQALVEPYPAAAPAGGLLQDPLGTIMAALKQADRAALKDAVSQLNTGEVGFTLVLQDEALPESSWTGTLAGLEPLLDLLAPPAS